jgi:hypothetical protein
MPDHTQVYKSQAEQYDLLISRQPTRGQELGD